MAAVPTEPAPKIYGALAGVMADVTAVAKDKVNKVQGFKFRSIDDVYNALHPALAKHKVIIAPSILERTSEVVGKTKNGIDMVKVVCTIKFRFFAEDGSYIDSVIVGEGLDTGDKGTNKAMAIAYKYACFQVFCIPTEDMIDPDAERPELAEGVKPVEKHKQEGEKPISPEMVEAVRRELDRTGFSEDVVKNLFKLKALEDLNRRQYDQVMKKFSLTKNKEADTIE